jgi:hypothetical protein
VSPNHGKHPDGNTRITKDKWQKNSKPFINKKEFFSRNSFQAFFRGKINHIRAPQDRRMQDNDTPSLLINISTHWSFMLQAHHC